MFIAGSPISYQLKNRRLNKQQFVLILLLGLPLGIIIAYLITIDLWLFVVPILLVLPIFVLLHRYPLVGVFVWLLLTQFLVAIDSSTLRKLYWLIHRALPPITLSIVILSYMLRIHKRKLPRLGIAELAMVGYLVVTQLSIIFFSDNISANTYHFYDRVFVPMCLYLLIRLIQPAEKEIKRLIPILIFILITQSIIGFLSWSAPQMLPNAWLGRAGSRTTGSLQAYSVFTVTAMTCGLFILHNTLNTDLSKKRHLFHYALFALACFMVFFSFSRGSWLAGSLVFLGLMVVYRSFMTKFLIIVVPLVVILLGVGLLRQQAEWASQRFYSDRSAEAALSRLPIYYASYRMFEEKPILGWGYGNFDRYDRLFQARVGDLINAEKDHASHNLYLTIVAEQGVVGLFFFLVPLLYWLALSLQAFQKLPADGLWSRKLLVLLWLMLLFHFIVNNFSNMKIVYGLGMWWITLGFIAVLVSNSLAAESHQPEVNL